MDLPSLFRCAASPPYFTVTTPERLLYRRIVATRLDELHSGIGQLRRGNPAEADPAATPLMIKRRELLTD